MVGSSSKVGDINSTTIATIWDDDLLDAEISEKDFQEQVQTGQNKPQMTRNGQTDPKKLHICTHDCNIKYPLHSAIREGDCAKFKTALENNGNFDEKDCQGKTLLHCIASAEPSIHAELYGMFKKSCGSLLRNKNFLNVKDFLGNTALHCAAHGSVVPMVDELQAFGAANNLVNNDNEIPLAKATRGQGSKADIVSCVEILLDALQENDLDTFGPKALLNAVKYSTDNPPLMELLLKRIKFKGVQQEPDKDGNPGFTLLQRLVYWTDDDSLLDLETLKILLSALDKEDINAICHRKSWFGQTALQIAAEENSNNAFKLLLANDFTDIFVAGANKRTVLHTIVDAGWSVDRENCLIALLSSPKLNDEKEKMKLLVMEDEAGETALQLAIRRDSVALSRSIIVAYPGDPSDWLTATLMTRIYEKVPEIMIPLMNSSIQFERKNYEAGDELFETDLGPVIGYDLNREAASCLDHNRESHKTFKGFHRETDFLSIILDSVDVKIDEKESVLSHPLVALFIHEKWKKLSILFWLSFFTNIVLLALYTLFVVDIFLRSCPYNNATSTSAVKSKSKCDIETWQVGITYFTVVAQLGLVSSKIFVDCVTTGFKSLLNLENIAQILFTIGVVVIVIGVSVGLQDWHHWVTSTTVLLASFLAFSQLLKIPSLGLYADIFYTVLGKMIRLMVTFCPLLIGFTVAITLVLPEYSKFKDIHFNIIKILIMMTGEINYDDVFYAEYQTPFQIYAVLLYGLFAVIVAIVIFNLLLGFTISDIQALENVSELQILASTLEQVVVFERLVLSKLSQKILPKTWLRRFLVVTHRWNSKSYNEYSRVMEKIPMKLRKRILELAKEQQQQHSKKP